MRLPALAQFIECDRQYDDPANDYLLPVRVDSQQIAAVGEQAHDKGAHQCAQHAAFPAAQAAAADDDRRNRLQLVTFARRRRR